jgi:hypothetical protein
MVRQICDKAGVFDQGSLVALGEPGEAVRSFREHLLRRQAAAEVEQLGELLTLADSDVEARDSECAETESVHGDDGPTRKHGKRSSVLRITNVRFDHPNADIRPYLLPGEPLTISVGYHADRALDDVVPGIAVYDLEGRMLFGANNLWFPTDLAVEAGDGEFVFELSGIPLLDGTYPVTIGLVTRDEGTVYDWREQNYQFTVMNPTRCGGTLLIPTNISLHRTAPSSSNAGPAAAVEMDQPLGA